MSSTKNWLEYERTLTSDPIGWDHSAFDEIKILIEEEINFLEESVNVECGEECRKCKSTKTYIYQKQVRSADEGFTSYTICFICGHQTIE